MVRAVRPDDADSITAIYNHYVRNTIITFEETPVSTEEMSQRIKSNGSNLPWLIYEKDHQLLGYAHASNWKSRCAYANSVESTIYLKPEESNKGIGYQLYTALIEQLTIKGFHAIIGGIALPNEASIALHEKLGFEKVAHFKEVGFKFDQWIDVGYWELLISTPHSDRNESTGFDTMTL